MIRNRVPHSPVASPATNTNRRRFHTFGLSVAILATLLIVPGRFTLAAVTSNGDINLTSGLIGINALGSMQVTGGSTQNNITGTPSSVGVNAGSIGSVAVTGFGSVWHNSNQLRVGESGTGQLMISGGGYVNNTFGYIGFNDTGDGSVTVTGSGSHWDNTSLIVGLSGTGQLTVSAGGLVEGGSSASVGGGATGDGRVTVTGSGSVWNNGQLSVGNGGMGQVTVSNGGQVNNSSGSLGGVSYGVASVSDAGSLWNNSSTLRVGDGSTGQLTVSNGGQVNNTIGYLGYFDTGDGAVTVTGSGSLWNNSNELNVGYDGTGQLTISGGGRVDNTTGFLGYSATGNGAATVTGPGSLWNNSSGTYVGFQGTGHLTITGGGQVNNTGGEIGYTATGNGSVTVTGAGSLLNNSGQIRVAAAGMAQLTISGGGRVNNTITYIADSATGNGTATVTGPGSLWNNSSAFSVGTRGQGQLTVSDGGRVNNTVGTIGALAGADGSVTVTGAGSVWDNSQDLAIGGTAGAAGGSGVLDVYSGGTVNVTGAIRIWSSGALYLNGGTINAGRLERLAAAGPADLNAGQLNLLGPGSNLGTALTIGDSSSAQATLRLATGSGAVVGALSLASDGVLHLDGGSLTATSVDATAGTILWNRGELHLAGGDSLVPQGLAVPDFSLLAGNGDVAGTLSGAPQSTIRVEGGNLTLGVANSFLGFNHAGVLEVGANAVTLRSLGFANLGVLTTMVAGGTLTAANGVALDAGDNFQGAGTISARVAQRVGSTIGATGNLMLGDAGAVDGYVGEGVLSTGTNTVTLLDANQAVLGSLTTLGSGGTSGILIAPNGIALDFAHNLIGQGTVQSTNSLAKAAIINGSVGGTGSGLEFTGYVKGVGTFSNVTFSGTYSPGLSPAAVNLRNVNFAPSNTLLVELGGTTAGSQYDTVSIGDNVGLDGTLSVALLNGFQPSHNDQFTILTFASRTGDFATKTGLDLGSRLQLIQKYTPTTLILTASQGGSGAWNINQDGVASAPGNWANGLPNGVGDVATFGAAITQARTVTVDVPTTLGRMVFDNAQQYTLAGTSAVTLNVASGNPRVEVLTGSHEIATPLTLAGPSEFRVAQATDTLTITGPIGGAAGLTKSGDGVLVVLGAINYGGDTTIAAGEMRVAQFNPATTGTAHIHVQGGARLVADSIQANTLTIGGGASMTIPETTGGATNAVPEPSTVLLLGVGIVGLLAFAWRRR